MGLIARLQPDSSSPKNAAMGSFSVPLPGPTGLSNRLKDQGIIKSAEDFGNAVHVLLDDSIHRRAQVSLTLNRAGLRNLTLVEELRSGVLVYTSSYRGKDYRITVYGYNPVDN